MDSTIFKNKLSDPPSNFENILTDLNTFYSKLQAYKEITTSQQDSLVF